MKITPEQFIYWLEGFTRNEESNKGLTKEEWNTVKERLEQVIVGTYTKNDINIGVGGSGIANIGNNPYEVPIRPVFPNLGDLTIHDKNITLCSNEENSAKKH